MQEETKSVQLEDLTSDQPQELSTDEASDVKGGLIGLLKPPTAAQTGDGAILGTLLMDGSKSVNGDGSPYAAVDMFTPSK